MAGSVNRVTLVGHIGADPEITTLASGGLVANFSVATSDSWKDKTTGEKKERTEWHRCVVWTEGLINVIEQYCRKGQKVLVEGQLQTRKWQDKDGNDRYSTEVVLSSFDAKFLMLDRAGGDREQGDNRRSSNDRGGEQRGGEQRSGSDRDFGRGSYGDQSGGRAARNGGGRSQRDMDDEIPF